MTFTKQAVILISAALIAVSCAKSESEDYTTKEDRSFERWISMYINTNPSSPIAKKLPRGGYIQLLSEDTGIPAQYPEWGDHVEINYRGMLLSDWDHVLEKGSFFMTRWEEDAERIGSFQYYTHYAPQLIQHSYSNSIMEGMQDALQQMKVGDMVRLYLPSYQAYSVYGLTPANANTGSTTVYTGYEGNTSQPSGKPIIVELELAGIVSQPQTKEEQFVMEFAETQWGQTIADTVRQYIFLKFDDDHNANLDKDSIIGVDSTLTLKYVARLAYDDFLIDTNSDSVAKLYNRTASSLASYKPSNPPSSPVAAAVKALTEIFESDVELRYGQKFEFISTSIFAYGSAGQTGTTSTTEVLPYQPVIYEVWTEEWVDPNDDEEE